MEYNEYGDDRHCMVMCKNCNLTHCYLCHDGRGLDDDELKVQCLNYPDWHKVYDGSGKHIGRKSGTGWPRAKKN
jgi:hypothetical protein